MEKSVSRPDVLAPDRPHRTDPITAVIVDRHPAIVAGVRNWCEKADPPIGLIDARARHAGVWTGPGATADVVIFDPELVVGRPNFGEVRRLVDSGRRVVVYSPDLDRATASKCLGLGALAYLTKREGPEHLVPAVRAAARGVPHPGPAPFDTPGLPRLSPRETEVLRAWFYASSKELVAEELHISMKTVDTHIARVRTKYANVGRAARTKSELVSRALDDGVVTLAELNRAAW